MKHAPNDAPEFKWGGVQYDEVTFEAFDLEQLIEQEPRVPSSSDWEILASILDRARVSPQSVTSFKKSLATLLPSNDAERDVLCAIC